MPFAPPPTRETAAATVGPRLNISPVELKPYLDQPHGHGLSDLIKDAKAWEPFAWKGNDVSAPLRALWYAECCGLLKNRDGRDNKILIADVTAAINEYLASFGKRPITIGTVKNNLSTAAKYVAAALGCSLVVDSQSMTVCFVNQYDNAENIERYYQKIEAQLKKLSVEVLHAKQNNYDIDHIIAASSEKTGMTLQLSGSAD